MGLENPRHALGSIGFPVLGFWRGGLIGGVLGLAAAFAGGLLIPSENDLYRLIGYVILGIFLAFILFVPDSVKFWGF